MIEHSTITIDRLPRHLKLNFQARRSVFLLSEPGVGKTKSVEEFAKEINAPCFVMVASLRDRVDYGGLPFRVQRIVAGRPIEVTEFVPLQLFADLSVQHNPDGGPVVLYFNELNSAPDTVLAVLFRLFLERSLEHLTLRDNVFLIADGNPRASQSVGRDLPQAMRRRFAWVLIEKSLPAWKKWALQHGIDARIISFLEVPSFTQHFGDFDPTKRERITYSTPASWEFVSQKLALFTELQKHDPHLDQHDLLVMLSGEVGHAAGTAFTGFLSFEKDLPDTASILRNPKDAPLPKGNDMRALLCGNVLNFLRSNPEYLSAALLLAERFFTDKQEHTPEWAVFLVRSLFAMPEFTHRVLSSPVFEQLKVSLDNDDELREALLGAASLAA